MTKQHKKDSSIFGVILIFSFLLFMPYLINGHMATDSYRIFDQGYLSYAVTNPLLDGRVITGLLWGFMDFLQMDIVSCGKISVGLAIIVSCITIMILKTMMQKMKKPTNLFGEIILTIACYYTIFHFMYLENLYFLESVIMAFSILFYVLAAKVITQKEDKHLIKAIILTLLGVMCYQGTISMLWITLLVISFCQGDTIKQVVQNLLKGVVITGIAIIIDNVEIKLMETVFGLEQERGFSFEAIISNIGLILSNIISAIQRTGSYLPFNSFLGMVILLETGIFIKIEIDHRKKKDPNHEKILLGQLAILVVGIFGAFVVSLISISAFWSGRLRFSLGAVIGFVWIFLWVKTDLVDCKNKRNMFLIGLLLCYGLLNSVIYIQLIHANLQVSQKDQKVVDEIEQYVIQYEKEKKVTIKKIAIVIEKGKIANAFYQDVKYQGAVITNSAIRTVWSIKGCYHFYTGTSLEEYEPTEQEIKNYFEIVDSQKNYQAIGDTLYITAYMY